jgi:hypothetical protein
MRLYIAAVELQTKTISHYARWMAVVKNPIQHQIIQFLFCGTGILSFTTSHPLLPNAGTFFVAQQLYRENRKALNLLRVTDTSLSVSMNLINKRLYFYIIIIQ